MEVSICCLLLTALSAMTLDLSQTAEFTKGGVGEVNPILRSVGVEERGSRGETVMAIGLGAAYLAVQNEEGLNGLLLGGAIGHSVAAWHNRRMGTKGAGVWIAPIVMVRW